jgi:hypothetical protein
MNKEEFFEKLKTAYEVSKEYLKEHKGLSAFLGGSVVGFILGLWVS